MDTDSGQAERPSDSAKILMRELSQAHVVTTESDAARLNAIADRKYNRYDLFSPGDTFQHRLVNWLYNFDEDERQTALQIVRDITFLSQKEMRALATNTFNNIIGLLSLEIATLPQDSAVAFLDSRCKNVRFELSKSLFVGMADDVLFDFFRRNAQMSCEDLKRDNFVEYYKLDKDCRADLMSHRRVFLIDQLSASAYTAIHKDETSRKWKGKIPTFAELWPDEVKRCTLYYCPYILSSKAEGNLAAGIEEWSRESDIAKPPVVMPASRIGVSSCLRLASLDAIDETKPVAALCRKYYDRFEANPHEKKGGPCTYGFGSSGLTLVLNTNCPNNSLYLMWHSYGDWYPLFPRVKHHQ
jgi:hypothetical protein